MGTTLTGTTPQDTYDSLIKVTDNGPLSGTAKYLSDGLGNDSVLALSTGNVGVGTTTITTISGTNPVLTIGGTAISGGLVLQRSGADKGRFYESGDLVIHQGMSGVGHSFYVNAATEAVRITSSGNVGIGTSSPTQKLTVNGNAAVGGQQAFWLRDDDGFSSNAARRAWAITANYNTIGTFSIYGASAANSDPLAGTAFLNITSAGVLDLNQGQIKFPATQVASADPNTLDDYEEGTFTPTIIGSTTAGTATYGGGQAGTYTKIGNVVYFQIYLGYSGGTGTGDLRIAGLPFTIPASDLPSFTFGVFLNVALTALNVPIAGGIGSTSQIYINQIPTGGGAQTSVPYDDAAVIQISGFYRV